MLDEAQVKLRELLGPDAYQNALICVRRASVFQLQQDWGNAAIHYREAIRIAEKFYGPDHFSGFSWNFGLAQVLSRLTDKRSEAAQLVDSLIERWGEKDDISREYAELILLRCDLYEDNRQSARELALNTLKRPGLIATPEQLQALRHHAREP